MFRKILLSLFILAIAAPAFAADQAPKTLRVYFVGNSVTDTINYRGLAELAKSQSYTQAWGRHMIPGAPLQWIWQHPKDGFQEQPFGYYPTALANFQWDVLSLQPFDRHLDGKDGDIAMARNFIDLALPKSPDLQIYVYARWPRQGKDEFDTAWLKKYTGGWDNTNETKDYFERLTLELRKAYPKLKKPILMVPVGHVLYELNQRMKAGQVPGYTHIKQLFADGIHLNNVGSYVVGCTYFATLYKQNPKGLPSAPYKVEDAKLAGIIQDVVWKVVSANKLAGVKNMTEKASPTKTAFKGWELYIWEEKGKTYFSLMFGTNRLKPREEIVKEAVKGIDAIKAKLDELKPGELVGIAGKEEGTTPPKAQSDQVLEYCKTLGLKAWRHQ
jgi:hypothetical protein